jgi:hypothetical protein
MATANILTGFDSQEGMALSLRDWRSYGKGVMVEDKFLHEIVDLI